MSKDCFKKTTNVTIKGTLGEINGAKVVFIEDKESKITPVDINETLAEILNSSVLLYEIQITLTATEDYGEE